MGWGDDDIPKVNMEKCRLWNVFHRLPGEGSQDKTKTRTGIPIPPVDSKALRETIKAYMGAE